MDQRRAKTAAQPGTVTVQAVNTLVQGMQNVRNPGVKWASSVWQQQLKISAPQQASLSRFFREVVIESSDKRLVLSRVPAVKKPVVRQLGPLSVRSNYVTKANHATHAVAASQAHAMVAQIALT